LQRTALIHRSRSDDAMLVGTTVDASHFAFGERNFCHEDLLNLKIRWFDRLLPSTLYRNEKHLHKNVIFSHSILS
jgi:hypothetical protein